MNIRTATRAIILVLVTLSSAMLSGCIPMCVLEESLVLTPDGEKPVEDLSVGDEVISMAPDGKSAVSRVVAKHSSWSNAWLEIKTADHERPLRVTAVHPIAVPNGWRKAGDTTKGDQIQTEKGLSTIESVTHRRGRNRVYDLTVQPHANFFADGVLVHNKSFARYPRRSAMVGIWIGRMDSPGNIWYRMELDDHGDGICALTIHGAEDRTSLYRITHWSLRDYSISIHFEVIDSKHSWTIPNKLHGRASEWAIHLKIPQRAGYLDRELLLLPESTHGKVIESLKNRMAEYRTAESEALSPKNSSDG